MNALLAMPLAVPLLGAALTMIVRARTAQRVISFVALAVSLGSAIAVLAHVAVTDEIAVSSLGGWPAPVAITLVGDRLSAMMLVIAVALLCVVLVFAIGQRASDERSPFYHPVYLVLSAGIAQAFLAGDLFNLFVAFELLLMSSYVLLTLEGTDAQIRSGTTYVVLNVVESTVLLTAVGLVFAATGTVSMADLPARLAELPDGVRTGLNLLLLVSFGIKAAVFPLFFWLPDAYPTAPSSVTAVFAGLLTKVGIYAMIRTETLLFPGGESTLLLWIAGFTMIIGVLGAMSHVEMKRILSFHIVSQIGYMVMGIAIGTEAALAATVFFLLHQIPVKTALFLVQGIVERETGTTAFDDVGGLARRSGFLAALFLIPALSLAGLPPFSGFLGKYALVRAGFEDGRWVIVTVALVGSLLTLVSMTKIWIGVFWGEVYPEVPAGRVGILRHHRLMSGSTIVLVLATLAIAALAGPLFDYCRAAGEQLVDASTYVRAVVGP
ncbi:MAG: proton-conducting transporter membrane subunit [Actinobacteria bacterium]|nr:proton-conducting transporter membrane subunit [Actinomycetota bacterium]